MRPEIKLENLKLKILWNLIFRKSYSPKIMRVFFNFVAGRSVASLQKKFPRSQFIAENIHGVPTETIVAANCLPENGTIIYLHGGGYFMGSIFAYRSFALKLSFVTQCKVLIIDYRLAPENPYPTALNDIGLVYNDFLQKNPSEKVILGGDSAGGGLTMATLLRLREFKIPLPHKSFVISPWVDLEGKQDSYKRNHLKDSWLSKSHTDVWAKLYTGNQKHFDAFISPVLGEYFMMPTTAFFVGDQEVLMDECIALHKNYERNNSLSQLFVGIDMQHTWMIVSPKIAESRQFSRDLKNFLNDKHSK